MANKTKNYLKAQQADKNPAGAPTSIVMTQIDVRPWTRREQDIPSWRTAHRSAESLLPRRVMLYDLYADVELDGHVESVTSKRRDAVTTANWQFVDKAGKPVDAVNDLVDTIGFSDMLEDIVNSKFWGYSIFEPTFWKNHEGRWEMAANLLPRINYRTETGIIAADSTSEEGINIREGYYAKTIMEVGKPKDLGLYLKAAPYQILKRGGLGDWGLFVQVFGNPIVDATWDGFDESQRVKLLEAVQALGSGGALVRPKGTEVTLLENKTNANGDLQDKFMTFLNKEISKALLGSTETTEASTSSGYAQSQTHAEQDERKNESDIQFTRRILNSRFTQILASAGFDVSGGSFIIEGENNELTVKESFDMQMRLLDKGLPIADDFFYEKYGIPKPDNYDKIKADKEAQKEAVEEAKDPKDQKGKKPVNLSDDFEEEFLEAAGVWDRVKEMLSSFFVSAPAKNGATKTVTDCCGNPLTLAVSDKPDFSKLIRDVVKAEGKNGFYPELIEQNAKTLIQGFELGWKGDPLVKLADLGFEYHTLTPKAQTAWELNIFQFSTVKAAYQSQEVNALFRQAKSYAEFERLVNAQFGIKNSTWLATEYATAYQVGQLSATYYRLLEQVKIFPYWQYKTIGDDRVRDSHRLLHDAVFPVLVNGSINPIWAKIFPPNGWGCRCYIVPRMAAEITEAQLTDSMAAWEQFKNSDDWAKAVKDGFGINRADTTQVFDRSQFYSEEPGKVLKKAAKMYYQDWGLKGIRETQEAKGTAVLIDTQGIDAKGAALSDYAGRTLNFTRSNQASRYPNALPDVLANPDEVWVNDETGAAFDSYVYLKYYRNEILKVIANLDAAGELEIRAWSLADLDDTKHRRGLLIRK
jgi:phage gp29-like protein